MSINVMSWVWEHSPTKGSDRLVLLAIADNANDQGEAWPSLKTIADKCNLSRRYVIDIIARLEAEGHLTHRERIDYHGDKRNLSNVYTILMVKPSSPASEAERTNPSEAEFTRVVRSTSPEPSVNHQLEPEEDGASARPPVRVPASGKKKDPLLGHPAIIAYHDAARRHVPVVWREQVARTVGDTPPQVERWKKLVIDWCGSGWNAGNVKGMLERFANPGPAQRGAVRTSQPITISSLGLRGADE